MVKQSRVHEQLKNPNQGKQKRNPMTGQVINKQVIHKGTGKRREYTIRVKTRISKTLENFCADLNVKINGNA